MLNAQLFPSSISEHDRNYPPHNRCVDIVVNMTNNDRTDDSNNNDNNDNSDDDDDEDGFIESYVVLGSDLTKEYVDVNADYRS
jgi:hypothetical protein